MGFIIEINNYLIDLSSINFVQVSIISAKDHWIYIGFKVGGCVSIDFNSHEEAIENFKKIKERLLK